MVAGKRGNNAGSISELKDATGRVTGYRAQLTTTAGGRRSFPRVGTRREAQRQLDEAKALQLAGKLGPGKSETIAAYLDGWIATVTPNVKSSTHDTYARNVRRISTHIGTVRLANLTPSQVQDCYNALLAGGLSPRSVRQVHLTIHKAIKDAVRLDLIPRNPTEGAILPRVARTEMNWYSAEDLSTLFTATKDDRFHALWVVLGSMALRLGEALGLKWSDVEWNRGTLTVQRALQRDRSTGKLTFIDPKTARSRRTIEMPQAVIAALQTHRERQAFEKRSPDILWQEHDLIFSTRYGTPLDQGRVHVNWTAATTRANVPRHRVHDLRHTVATHLLVAGMNPIEVANLLGHSSPSLVLEVYGHAVPTSRTRAANLMDALLTAKTAL